MKGESFTNPFSFCGLLSHDYKIIILNFSYSCTALGLNFATVISEKQSLLKEVNLAATFCALFASGKLVDSSILADSEVITATALNIAIGTIVPIPTASPRFVQHLFLKQKH